MTPEEKRKRRKEYSRRYREKYPERVRAASRKWREANPEKMKAARKAWTEKYPQKYAVAKKRNASNKRKRIRTDPEYALAISAYSKAYHARKGKQRKTVLPTWLKGQVPQVPVKTATIHLSIHG